MSQPAVEASIRGRRWRPWFPAALAAAAVVTVIVWPQRAAQETPSVLRDLPPQDSARFAPSPRPSVAQAQPNPSSSRLIVPRGRVVRAESFVWRPVSGAERYRLWLYDAEGTVLWTTVTPDTLVARPDSVPLATGQAYFWKVDAQVEWPRWISSPLVEFLVTGPSP